MVAPVCYQIEVVDEVGMEVGLQDVFDPGAVGFGRVL